MEPKGAVFSTGEATRPFAVSGEASLHPAGYRRESRRLVGDQVVGPRVASHFGFC